MSVSIEAFSPTHKPQTAHTSVSMPSMLGTTRRVRSCCLLLYKMHVEAWWSLKARVSIWVPYSSETYVLVFPGEPNMATLNYIGIRNMNLR